MTSLTEPTNSRSKLRTTAYVFGAIAAAIPVLTAVLSALSLLSGDIAASMVTSLLVVPLGIVVAGIAGLTTCVLAVVLRARGGAAATGWVLTLCLGIFGLVAIPLALLVLVTTLANGS